MKTFLRSLVVVGVVAIAIAIAVAARRANELSMENDPVVVRLKRKLASAFPEIAKVRVLRGDSSYTIDKKNIFLCTQSPDTGTPYDDNMLVYVLLHELAHTINAEIGHGRSFFDTFQSLLDRAKLRGLYDPYLPRPSNYCEAGGGVK